MTTQAEIDNEIKKDYNNFWHSVYDAMLPDSFMYKFRQAIMFHNAQSINTGPQVLKALIAKKEEDLSFLDVGICLNIIFAVPFNCLYDSPEQVANALAEYREIEKYYNETRGKKAEQLERKRLKKYEICGIKSTVPLNGLKPL